MSPSSNCFAAALLAALAVANLPRVLPAQDGGEPRRPRTTLEVAAEWDGLSGAYADWTAERVRLDHRVSTRSGLAVASERLERFGRSDVRVQGEFSLALGRRVTLGASVESSETHRVVARSGYGARLHVSLGAGWGFEGSASLRRFEVADVRGAALALERYFSQYVVSYAFATGSVTGAKDVASHQGRLTRFFGERGSLTAGASTGREAESLGESSVLVMDVQSAGLWGVLPLGPRLDLTWAAGTTTQGDLFTRTHLALGARVLLR